MRDELPTDPHAGSRGCLPPGIVVLFVPLLVSLWIAWRPSLNELQHWLVAFAFVEGVLFGQFSVLAVQCVVRIVRAARARGRR